MKSTNRGAPFAWKISGPHTSAENAVPAAPNPSAADVRGHRLKNLGYLMHDIADIKRFRG